MNQTGHKIETTEDENGYRQFVVNCVGIDDQRKYFSISPFGIDFNPPETLRVVTSESRNKDESFNIGVLNKIKIDDLNLGESAIFSTDDVGEAIVSQIVLRNTGDIEINKDFEENASVIIGVDGSIQITTKTDLTITSDENINLNCVDANIVSSGDVNITADGNVAVTATQLDVNGNLTVD